MKDLMSTDVVKENQINYIQVKVLSVGHRLGELLNNHIYIYIYIYIYLYIYIYIYYILFIKSVHYQLLYSRI